MSDDKESAKESKPDKYTPLAERLLVFVEEFRKESDRACIIVCAAKIDYLLFQILGKFLMPNPGSQDELLDSDRALGTFSSRIQMCYRLGLIDADFARAINLLRKLRNSFAHETSSSTLDAGAHRDRVREMAAPLARFAQFSKSKDFFKHDSQTRTEFHAVMAVMMGRLEKLLHDLKPLKPIETMAFVPEKWE